MNRLLRGLRIAHDYSLEEMSQKLGISQSYVLEIENGEKKPSDDIITKYCKMFHISKKVIKMFSNEANTEKDINNKRILLMMLDKICGMGKR